MLNPDGVWFWVLYTLAGIAVVIVTRRVSDSFTRLEGRRVLPFHPLSAMVLWLLWPVFAALLLYLAVTLVGDWIHHRRCKECRDHDKGERRPDVSHDR